MSFRKLISRRHTGGPGQAAPAQAGARLLWEANAILSLITQLRATSFVSDLARLRNRIVELLTDFQARARAGGIEAPRVAKATEVLSVVLDHVVTSMPWGADASWQPLDSASVRSSGHRSMQRLLEVARGSSSDAGMKELTGVALLLGLDKRSLGEHGSQIDQVLARLTPTDSIHGSQVEKRLLPQWSSAVAHPRLLTSWLPFWVSSFVIAALLAVLFLVLELSLGARSDRLYARIAALNGPTATTSRPQPAPDPRLAGVLSAQVIAGNLFVRDEIDRSVIVVPEVKLFEADKSSLLPAGNDLLRPITAAIRRIPGRIQVIGHTDGTLARSARYPSDWELSVDRARVVQEALRAFGVEASRLVYDGRANIEPLRADDQARTLSGNGRIEIVLLVGR
jgi:type VI secretion system protein ImpK